MPIAVAASTSVLSGPPTATPQLVCGMISRASRACRSAPGMSPWRMAISARTAASLACRLGARRVTASSMNRSHHGAAVSAEPP
ncbi:hypothetical protein ACFQX6_65580 [Streptosporangium lutulentum]